MAGERVAALLEKYFQAETTVEEEQELAEYFRNDDILPEWAPYRELFSFFAEEAQVRSGQHLEEKIMQQVRPRLQVRWSVAAAAILILGMSLFLMYQPSTPVVGMKENFKDTYNDPQQALAAVQKALFRASEKMNKGLRPLK
jgi:hypothetical protein